MKCESQHKELKRKGVKPCESEIRGVKIRCCKHVTKTMSLNPIVLKLKTFCMVKANAMMRRNSFQIIDLGRNYMIIL